MELLDVFRSLLAAVVAELEVSEVGSRWPSVGVSGETEGGIPKNRISLGWTSGRVEHAENVYSSINCHQQL